MFVGAREVMSHMSSWGISHEAEFAQQLPAQFIHFLLVSTIQYSVVFLITLMSLLKQLWLSKGKQATFYPRLIELNKYETLQSILFFQLRVMRCLLMIHTYTIQWSLVESALPMGPAHGLYWRNKSDCRRGECLWLQESWQSLCLLQSFHFDFVLFFLDGLIVFNRYQIVAGFQIKSLNHHFQKFLMNFNSSCIRIRLDIFSVKIWHDATRRIDQRIWKW